MLTFQQIIGRLSEFWANQGCLLLFGYDTEKGAGTMSPHTFLRALGPKPISVAYVEPSRRPTDGRYAQNPNRLQHYFQYQVLIKPSVMDIQDLYIQSLLALGINPQEHDIRFVEDNWEAPTLGAWGLGWEVWLDGMEVTQFTYFQQCGGFPCDPISVEITYGLERLAMFIQKKNSVFDLVWQKHNALEISYADIYKESEKQQSQYNFELANIDSLFTCFDLYEKEADAILAKGIVDPAYDYVLKCSHTFNLLDARGAISVSERAKYMLRIRKLAQECAKTYLELELSG